MSSWLADYLAMLYLCQRLLIVLTLLIIVISLSASVFRNTNKFLKQLDASYAQGKLYTLQLWTLFVFGSDWFILLV
jgi:hypothetical protein